MFSKDQVEVIILNEGWRLLGLGAPIKDDMQGFNKPDWNKMMNLLPSVSLGVKAGINQDTYAFIAETLVKYQRQIGDPFWSVIVEYSKENKTNRDYYDLKASVAYETASVEAKRPSIGAVVAGNEVYLSFQYNQQLVALVKQIKGRQWKVSEKVWSIPLTSVEDAMLILEPMVNVDCLEEISLEYSDKIDALFSEEEGGVSSNKTVITVIESGSQIGIQTNRYNETVIATIKGIIGRRYEQSIKTWWIPANNAEELYFELSELEDVDCSALEMFGSSDSVADSEIDLDKYGGLFDHQKMGINFLVKKTGDRLKGKILADDMGLGKTRQSIISAFEIAQNTKSDKILIIPPASLKLNWDREIKMVYPFADVFVVNGKGWDNEIVDDCAWVVINYDMLKKYENEVHAREWGVVIADEAHFIKNKASNRAKIFLGHFPKNKTEGKPHKGVINAAEKIILLTGTPVTSRPSDLYNLLKACGHPLAANWMHFVKRYCNAHKNDFGKLDTSGSSNLDELHRLTRNVILRRTKEECLDLPEKIRTMMPVAVDLTVYRRYWSEYKQKLAKEGRILQSEHLAMMAKLRQASAFEKVFVAIDQADTIIESGEKVIIFTNYTHVVDKVMEHFGDAAVKVVGGMTDIKKQSSVDRFQNDPNVKVFVGNIKAAGVGLTLTAATQVIFNDYSWNPTDHTQAEDRAYRIGQKNIVNVTYLNAEGTIDEELSSILLNKVEIISRIVDGKNAKNNELLSDLRLILVKSTFGEDSIRGKWEPKEDDEQEEDEFEDE